MRFLDPKTDFAFKKIFGSKKSKAILLSFLNSIMQLPPEKAIVDLIILGPFQLPKIEKMKYSILDVKCTDYQGHTYVVEMQLLELEAFLKRIVYNACKAYSHQLGVGEEYHKLNKVIAITIVNFSLFNDLPQQYITRHFLMEEDNKRNYIEEIAFYFVELPKFTQELSDLKTLADKWIYFLKYTGGLDSIPDELNVSPIAEAFGIANTISMSREELELYEKKQMYFQDELGRVRIAEKRGREEGKQEGEASGIEKTARNMIREGLEDGLIVKVTGLPKDVVKKLRKEMK